MSTICPRCGAIILRKINPTCYNCLRMERDQKRFGRRRPRKGSTGPPQPPIIENPRKKQTGVKGVTNQERQRKTIKLVEKKPKTKLVVVKEVINRERQRKAINQLLSDLYKPNSRYLSDILRDGGLTSQQIAQLKDELLAEYLDALVAELFAFWLKNLRWQEYAMLRTKYALEGKHLPTKRTLMKESNFSWEQIDKYREVGLRRMRFARSITTWETIVVETARSMLLNSGDVGRHHHS